MADTPSTPPSPPSQQPPAQQPPSQRPTASAPPRRRSSGLLIALIIGGIVIALPIAFCGLAAVIGSGNRPTVNKSSILEIRLAGSIEEAPNPNPFAQIFGPQTSPSLFNLRKAIHRANEDDRIEGVLLELEPLSLGMGTVDEVLAILDDLDESKPLYVILNGDMVSEGEYMVATAGDQIWMNPEAGMLLNGFMASISFYKGTLDKLHIKAEAFGFKEYKSASEPFVRKNMSKAFRESYDYVLSDFYQRFLNRVVERRKKVASDFMTADEFEQLVDRGLTTTKQALANKLVDELGYRDEALAALAQAAGVGPDEYDSISFSNYIRAISPPSGQQVSGDRVALVYGVGQIVAGEPSSPFGDGLMHGPAVARAIDKATDDDNVKAIVFRVNSPGGSPVGSDFIWRAIDRAKKKKPVIVSMGDVAGSGGYWVSMNATKIVAEPSTITGSIGIVFTKFDLGGFYDWIGVTKGTIKKGKNSDMFSTDRSLDPEDERLILSWMGELYDDFVNKAAEGRGMDPVELEKVAKGRIWTGTQGKDRGLVDELGDLGFAAEIARSEAGLGKDTPVVIYPRQKSFLEMLAEGDFSVKMPESPEIDMEALQEFVESEFGTSKAEVIMPEIELR